MTLAPRERQMVDLLVAGSTPREIAKICNTNHKNVYSTIGKVRRKMNCVTDRELVIRLKASPIETR